MRTTYVKLNGLTNGQSYTFTVSATNAQGTSAPSLPSHAIMPIDQKIELPGPPAKVEAFIDHGNASIHFQTPDSTLPKSQELPIIAYVVTIHPSGRKVYFTGRNVIALQESKHVTFSVINGLKPGQNYSFSVYAVNAAGEGKPVTAQAIPVSQ
jgi:titin